MIWNVPRMWEDGDVWIIGGGPSISQQFNVPDRIVNKVIEGSLPLSAYSPYMTALHAKHVIGVNVAYMLGEWVDMVFFGDSGFFLTHLQRLAQFPGLKVSCHPAVARYPWVKYTPRDNKHPRGISGNTQMVSWNGNSGAAAISIAVHAGAKRVILLGFDMKLSDGNRQHWHNVYGRAPVNVRDQRKMRKLPFDRHLRGFDQIARDAKHMGVEIVNACPDSAIREFPRCNAAELL